VAKALTDIAIQNLKPRAVRYEAPDSGARGLRVVVQPSGRKSFAVRYRNAAGRARKLTLPTGITLAAARKLTADALLEVAQGRDPGTAKRAARQTARATVDDTIERLVAQYIEQHVRRKTRPNSARATEGIFANIVLPAWGKRLVHDITRRDVIDLIESIAGDRPIAANRTKAALSKFFNWLATRDVIAASPCAGVPAPSREQARSRVLSDDELRRLWLVAETLGGRVGAYIKLLILTCQRRSEISGLLFREVDGNLLTIGAERMKGRIAHIVPLSSQAAAIIASMPSGRPNDAVLALSENFTRLKRALDAHMGETPHWVLHDIRRTVASGMAKIGIAIPVIERLLAHRSGTFKGVVGTYQRHSFLPEMGAAVQRWADHVERLVSGKSAKVVKLKQR
jgi:integrase